MINLPVTVKMRRYEQDEKSRRTCTQTYTSEARHCIATYIRILLLRSENPIACVAQPGQYITMLVEFSIDRRYVQIDVGMIF